MVLGGSAYGDLPRAQRLVAQGADYVAFGAFFASPTKPQAPLIPLQLLREARDALPCPIVAIGGITQTTAPELYAAGADGVAVISAIQGADNPRAAAASFASFSSS